MFWSRGSSRQRKAVLSALSAVGETGMTLLALGLAVNLPEGRLHTILEGLVRSGQVRRRGTPSSAIPGPRTAHYHLASGRHSAVPGMTSRRAFTEQPRERAVDRQSAAPLQRRAARSASMPITHAQGI
jgi:hypothetical protein